jgi:hypothetical protein
VIDIPAGRPVELLETAPGYRPALERSVAASRSILLEPGIRTELAALRPTVLEKSGRGAFLRLRPEFEPRPELPPWHRDVELPMVIGSGEPVTVTLPGPGLYRLFVTVRMRMGSLYGMREGEQPVRTAASVMVTDADEGRRLLLALPPDLLPREE